MIRRYPAHRDVMQEITGSHAAAAVLLPAAYLGQCQHRTALVSSLCLSGLAP